MGEVVGANILTCPSCKTQAIVRVWGCGCLGVDYPDHIYDCKQPRPYFDSFVRACQKRDTHGTNPQTH